jgi:hypothetical protein
MQNLIKLYVIFAEVLDLVVVFGWLLKRASEQYFDYVDAGIVFLFVCIGIIAQSIQQNIEWK